MSTIVITGGGVFVDAATYHPSATVVIQDGRVRHVGPGQPEALSPDAQQIDARGCVLTPGLVNAHTHAAMTLFRGVAEDMGLHQWLFEHILPLEERWVGPEMVYACTLLAAAEMLLGGVTCCIDAYFFINEAARAYKDAGMRAVVCQGVVDFPTRFSRGAGECLEAARGLVRRWGGDRLITPAIFPHSIYTCSTSTLERCVAEAGELGCGLYIHLSETFKEVAECVELHGRRPVELLEELGVLQRLDAAVHCTWISPSEARLMAAAGVVAVVCPESNMKLGCGMAPVGELEASGCTLAVGTDGAASNNNLDVLGELGTLARIAKLLSGQPGLMAARRVLEVGWSGGAAAARMKGQVGVIKPGALADIVVWDMDEPNTTPMHDPASALVYSALASQARDVIVDGRIVVRDRRLLTVDLGEVIEEVRRLARRIRAGM